MNCNINEENELYAWVILDQAGNFAHRSSIRKTGKNTYQYIAFKTFSPECRAYDSSDQAEIALSELNEKKVNAGLEETLTFHLEYVNLDKIINLGEKYKGETLVALENVPIDDSLDNTKINLPFFMQTYKCGYVNINSSIDRDPVRVI